MTGLEHALIGLRQALDSPRRHRVWRWLVRHRMASVRDVLALGERSRDGDAWLAGREKSLHRERVVLLRRLGELKDTALTARRARSPRARGARRGDGPQ